MKITVVIALLVIAMVGFTSRSHWLVQHGQITCDGVHLGKAKLYRSQRGDMFALLGDRSGGMPGVDVSNRMLMRCNTPAFTSVFGLLFSKEAEPSIQCSTMWKGGGSNDPIPRHYVTDRYAEFPWGTCTKLRLEY